MMRIVADTNLLIASIFWSGAPYKIVQQALDGTLEIIKSVRENQNTDTRRIPGSFQIVHCCFSDGWR
ncbi:hypothetical protein HY642_00085 [Candidatus Woesearchaeota archaeon]|nr:hypothetical protein [Candidatus Woesearchaeota archaeon]